MRARTKPITAAAPTATAGLFLTKSRVEAANSSRSFRSEEHTSELQSLMRISYAVFCLKNKKYTQFHNKNNTSKHTSIRHAKYNYIIFILTSNFCCLH